MTDIVVYEDSPIGSGYPLHDLVLRMHAVALCAEGRWPVHVDGARTKNRVSRDALFREVAASDAGIRRCIRDGQVGLDGLVRDIAAHVAT